MAGGLIFSLPLLYTMEMWWAGASMTPFRLLAGLLGSFLLLLGYNRYSGLRKDSSWTEVFIDSVEELGLGLILSTIILWLLGRITSQMNHQELLGKILVESVVVAIGFSVGTSQLGGAAKSDTGMTKENRSTPGVTKHIVLAVCGAVLFAANIAPTEEIVVIAVETPAIRLVGIAVLSILLTMLVLFYSNFRGAHVSPGRDKRLTKVLWSIVLYAVALICSAAILWFFGRFDNESLTVCLEQMIVLGFVASLGSSVGRLLLQ